MVAEAIPVPAPPVSPKRLPEKSLVGINRCCRVADCFFLLSAIFFQFAYCPWLYVSNMFQGYVFIGYAICTFVLWYATAAMAYRSRSTSDLITAFFFVAIPGLGALVFLAIRLGLWDKMVENGYRPGLIGFSLDPEQRRIMATDPEYTPSLKFELDGSRRKTVFSLTEVTFFLGAISLLAPAILIPVMSG